MTSSQSWIWATTRSRMRAHARLPRCALRQYDLLYFVGSPGAGIGGLRVSYSELT